MLGEDLYDKYGYVIFPKGFKFYHATDKILDFENSENYNYTLFTMIGEIYGFKHNIYEIELIDECKILLAITEINRCYCKNSLIEIAIDNNIFPNESINDAHFPEIKKNSEYRNKIIEFLRINNIYGWITPMDNFKNIEVCFFNKNQKEKFKIKLIKDNEIINSLDILKPDVKIGTSVKIIKSNKSIDQYMNNPLYNMLRIVYPFL